jgi:hypothetical protein
LVLAPYGGGGLPDYYMSCSESRFKVLMSERRLQIRTEDFKKNS